LPKPVEHALEGVLGVGRVALEALAILVLDIVKRNVAPLVLAVVDIPLIEKGDRAEDMLAAKPIP